MTQNTSNRPAEIFGYPVWNQSSAAKDVRGRHQCPFQGRPCSKKSRLIDFPFGVCSVEHSGGFRTICPHRFEEQVTTTGGSRVFEDIALHYFGDLSNIVAFPEVKLPHVGTVDYVLIRHKPMKPEVEDFVSVEFQSDSTTGTGHLVQGIRDFFNGDNLQDKSYMFGMNTYDSIKRAITQLMNKGIVYESWETKCYWVIQEYIYENLVNRYGFMSDEFSPNHASRFALYNLVPDDEKLTLELSRYISASVDDVYHGMRNNPNIPQKSEFVNRLNARLRLALSVQR